MWHVSMKQQQQAGITIFYSYAKVDRAWSHAALFLLNSCLVLLDILPNLFVSCQGEKIPEDTAHMCQAPCLRHTPLSLYLHEEAYLHQAIKLGIPYLEMCLGGQLLAHAFPAEVKKLPKVHIGFLRIHFTQEGCKDPLYQSFAGYQQAFQWHEDCFHPRRVLFPWLIILRASIKRSAIVNGPLGYNTIASSPKSFSTAGYTSRN